MDNLSTRTPAEIDGEIARLRSVASHLMFQAERAQETIDRIDGVQGTYEARYNWNSPEKREEARQTLISAEAQVEEIRRLLGPLHEEFARRPWNRYYLVTNTGGHVHSSTNCVTCFPTTQYAWLTEQSGMTHEALVEMAGEQACTVCFPDAPVDVLKRKSRLEAPERKKAREEREAKAAARNASKVIDPVDGREWKTERAATNAIAQALTDVMWYGQGHPSAPEWLALISSASRGLREKGVAFDLDAAKEKARKRVKKDGGTPKW